MELVGGCTPNSYVVLLAILLGELRERSSKTLPSEALAFFLLKQTKWLRLLLLKAWRFLERRASIVERAFRGQNLPGGKGYRETDLWITPTQDSSSKSMSLKDRATSRESGNLLSRNA